MQFLTEHWDVIGAFLLAAVPAAIKIARLSAWGKAHENALTIVAAVVDAEEDDGPKPIKKGVSRAMRGLDPSIAAALHRILENLEAARTASLNPRT